MRKQSFKKNTLGLLILKWYENVISSHLTIFLLTFDYISPPLNSLLWDKEKKVSIIVTNQYVIFHFWSKLVLRFSSLEFVRHISVSALTGAHPIGTLSTVPPFVTQYAPTSANGTDHQPGGDTTLIDSLPIICSLAYHMNA